MSHRYPRRILLTVTGMTPQIVTETLYALIHPQPPAAAFVPTEIHLITTSSEARSAPKPRCCMPMAASSMRCSRSEKGSST
ncbi:MAG: hypothetical protein FWC58_04070 [Desulfobulbus sp.]|nr:hypothetical protein [Desulfobulbus sp.]